MKKIFFTIIGLLLGLGATAYAVTTSTFVPSNVCQSCTAGSVIFSDGTGLVQDNASLFFDNTNNRLGIGNAAPTVPLEVTGTIMGTSLRSTGTAQIDTQLTVTEMSSTIAAVSSGTVFRMMGTTNSGIRGQGDGWLFVKDFDGSEGHAGVAGDLLVYNSAKVLLASGANNAGVTVDATKVGIASSTPWKTFSVAGTGAWSGLTSAGSTRNSVCIDADTKEIQENSASSCLVSALKYKKNVRTLTTGISDIMKLRPVGFDYKSNNKSSRGFIADEVVKVIPTAGYYSNGKINAYESTEILATVVKAMQEQQKEIELLKARITKLEKN